MASLLLGATINARTSVTAIITPKTASIILFSLSALNKELKLPVRLLLGFALSRNDTINSINTINIQEIVREKTFINRKIFNVSVMVIRITDHAIKQAMIFSLVNNCFVYFQEERLIKIRKKAIKGRITSMLITKTSYFVYRILLGR